MDTNFQPVLAALEEDVARLDARWPFMAGLGDRSRTSFYAFPLAMATAFPSLKEEQVYAFALGCRLLANAILLQDRAIDGPEGNALLSLRYMALLVEAHRQFHRLFPPESPFWERFQRCLAEYAGACAEEQRFRSGERPWREYTEEVGLAIVRGKNSVVRVVPAGLVALAADEAPFGILLEALEGLTVSSQMSDDLQDWKEDLRRGIPSVLLARMVPERPTGLDDAGFKKLEAHLTRKLYYEGHANHLLQLALGALADTRSAFGKYRVPGFDSIVERLERRLHSLRKDLARIVQENVRRAKRSVAAQLPSPGTPWQVVAWEALGQLLERERFGFGRAREVVVDLGRLGLGSGEAHLPGDVITRALVVDALADANVPLEARFTAVLEDQCRCLLERKLDDASGGWSFLPEIPDLPPDADTLAHVMRALLRAGFRNEAVMSCEEPLQILLDNRHPDGSFAPWVVPAAERTPLEERHAEMVRRLQEPGVDCDVVFNLLHALFLYDGHRFAEQIKHGLPWLEGQQQADGSWLGGWYAGPYASIHGALRLLTAVAPESPALDRAARFLRSVQRPDGSWGHEGKEGDPLSTALALTGLGAVARIRPEPEDLERARRGLEALERLREPGGGWGEQELYAGHRRGRHRSRTLVDVFVLKAALLWDDLMSRAGGQKAVEGGPGERA